MEILNVVIEFLHLRDPRVDYSYFPLYMLSAYCATNPRVSRIRVGLFVICFALVYFMIARVPFTRKEGLDLVIFGISYVAIKLGLFITFCFAFVPSPKPWLPIGRDKL